MMFKRKKMFSNICVHEMSKQCYIFNLFTAKFSFFSVTKHWLKPIKYLKCTFIEGKV